MTIDTRALVERALAAATDTRHLTLDAGAIQQVASAFRAVFGERPAAVVADLTTWEVAGQRVEAMLRQAGTAALPPIIFPVPLHADFEHVLELQSELEDADAVPVASARAPSTT